VKELIPDALDGERVDRVVALMTGLSRASVAGLVAAGAVRLSGRTVTTRSTKVTGGSSIDVELPGRADPEPVADPGVEVEVVYADGDVLVVDKPAGLVVHPGAGNAGGTLVQGLLARFPDLAGVGDPARPGIVHRLDKGTSGLLVVARSAPAHASLVAQLAGRSVSRRYAALVWGWPEPPHGQVDAPIGRSRRDPTRMSVSSRGKPARTGYRVRTRFDSPQPASLLSCRLETGRTHQIRVHLGAIGHPVVGDARYGGVREGIVCPRPFLHAEHLAFDHPVSGERLSYSSELAEDLRRVLDQLA